MSIDIGNNKSEMEFNSDNRNQNNRLSDYQQSSPNNKYDNFIHIDNEKDLLNSAQKENNDSNFKQDSLILPHQVAAGEQSKRSSRFNSFNSIEL